MFWLWNLVVEFLEDRCCQSQVAYLSSYSFFKKKKYYISSPQTAAAASPSGLLCSASALLALAMLVLPLYQDPFRGTIHI